MSITHEQFEAMRADWSNSTLVGWKLVYADGTEIRSTDMPFDDAPQDGVMFLIKYYSRKRGGHSREIQNGLDMYCLYSEQPLYLDLPPEIKKGKNVPREQFDSMLKTARAEDEIVIGMSHADVYPEN